MNEGLAIDLPTATTLETFLDEDRSGTGQSPRGSQPFRERCFRKRGEETCGNETGEETIALRVNWEDYTDKELGEAFERWARDRRPVKRFPEPIRRGKGKSTSVLAALDALSAMRLISHFPIQDAIERFQKVGLNRQADAADESNFRRQARVAVADFKEHFPWEDEPQNARTYKKRQGGGR